MSATPAEPVVYHGSLRVNGWAAAIFGVLSGATIYKSLHVSDGFFAFMGAAFALAAALFAFQSFRRLPRLTLNSDGFVIETGLVAKDFRWRECTEFTARPMFMVGAIEFRRDGKWIHGLILNQFDATTADICVAMNEWRVRSGV